MTSRLFLLLTLCVLFGTSLQQRKGIRKRLDYVEIMLDSVKAKLQVDIYELREAVSVLQNRSEENPLPDINAAADIVHLKSIMKRQDLRITVISKAISDEKVYTWDQINELKSDLNETKQLKQQMQELMLNWSRTRRINNKLTTELRKAKRMLENNKDDILELRKMFMTITQTTTEHGALSTTVSVPRCPDGWKKFQNTCYMFVRTKVTWDVANSRCADHGATLAEPNTRAKHEYLLQIAGQHVVVWIGGTDRQTEGTWVWSGSGRNIVSSLWAPGEPNQLYDDEDCLDMFAGGWNDLSCTESRMYMCEKQTNA